MTSFKLWIRQGISCVQAVDDLRTSHWFLALVGTAYSYSQLTHNLWITFFSVYFLLSDCYPIEASAFAMIHSLYYDYDIF